MRRSLRALARCAIYALFLSCVTASVFITIISRRFLATFFLFWR